MSMTLAEALKQVHLEPGRTYRERVDGKTVEVRVVSDPATDEPVPDGPPYILPWTELPLPGPKHVLTAVPGDPFPMKPVVIDESDLAPE